MLKRRIIAVGMAIVVAGLLVGCNKTQGTPTNTAKQYKDGTYYAEADDFDQSGWKGTVKIEVKDGKIVSADWNAIHKDGGDDKDTQSKNGEYKMVERGGAKAEWHEQAEKVEAYLVETQDPSNIKYKDEEGHTDAISGATIKVKEFFDLAKKALKDAEK
ncbi:FMN-binding protein [Acetivibrio straminisolvens]|uniref:FMN-binding domain-containing protein n=1 Tax=Acetivibrio straminisolvens JCM 21531 TaxID=1294263 RepID=W4V6X3_9FIRM|nr:FMN-binding protein [Acetivibrio straminisolvens]GAE88947.1 hypothetical protein JCM21531_2433 [Acetivibrio straminisolvens JCM 21531]